MTFTPKRTTQMSRATQLYFNLRIAGYSQLRCAETLRSEYPEVPRSFIAGLEGR